MQNPKHVLITGSSSGIGAALALIYAKPAVTLSLHGRDQSRLDAVATQAVSRGATVFTHRGNVTDAADMAAWITARDTALPLDLIIANAGISKGTSRGESVDQIKLIFDVNVSGVFNTIGPTLAVMKNRKRGQIALMSSLASFRGFPSAPAYCASKAAIRIYGEGLRGEMASYNVEVNVICPGFVQTPMTDQNMFAMPFMMTAERAAYIIHDGLERNQARIAFPWATYEMARFVSMLPQPLIDWVGQKLPKK